MTHRLIREADETIRGLRQRIVHLTESKLMYAERLRFLLKRLSRYEDIDDIEELLPWFMRHNANEVNDPMIWGDRDE